MKIDINKQNVILLNRNYNRILINGILLEINDFNKIVITKNIQFNDGVRNVLTIPFKTCISNLHIS